MLPKPSPESVAFRSAQLLIEEKLSATDVANRLKEEFPHLGERVTRESVYPLVMQARALGYLQLVPPLETGLARQIETQFELPPESVRVANCPAPGSVGSVSVAAAEWAVQLVRELHTTAKGPVGIGLGPGRATRDFSFAFGKKLENDASLPMLNLVAITAAGPAMHPEYCPTSFFNLFPRTRVDKNIGLFAETLVPSKSIQEIRTRPGCKEAFGARDAIHLVVTSMGDMADPHSLLSLWYKELGEQGKQFEPSWWPEAIGDIQYRPFGPTQFIKDKPKDLRAVTLFELDDMVHLATRKDRHVILIARQCGQCEPKRTRARVLLPILKNPHMRVFSRLVMDSPTAYELLQAK